MRLIGIAMALAGLVGTTLAFGVEDGGWEVFLVGISVGATGSVDNHAGSRWREEWTRCLNEERPPRTVVGIPNEEHHGVADLLGTRLVATQS